VGCGNSEGENITLGWRERHDLAIIIDHLVQNENISKIGLWGK
jgi:hypothetical protein